MDEEFVIKVEHLSKAYKLYEKKSDRLREALSITGKQYHKPFYALNDIAFEVKRGETVGIIGTNGSGKSTLLKILTGVVAPSGGSFEVNGRISALLELGTGFNMEYTGLQNIDLHGTMMGFSKEEMENRREQIIQFADIGDYINQPVKNYSSGMFARLAFAVAISIDPEILIVDEALSVGDVFFQNKCFKKFDELKEKGISILFVSHDISSVQRMCNRVLWIEQGNQRVFGSSYEVCRAFYDEQGKRMSKCNADSVNSVINKSIRLDRNSTIRKVPKAIIRSNAILSDKAEIVSAFIQDMNGNTVSSVEANNNYRIVVISKFCDEMPNIIIGFVMENAKGIAYLADNTYANKHSEIQLIVKQGDYLETFFEFTMPELPNGQYIISPAIAQGTQSSHVILTWLNGAISFDMHRDEGVLGELGWDINVDCHMIKDVEIIGSQSHDEND